MDPDTRFGIVFPPEVCDADIRLQRVSSDQASQNSDGEALYPGAPQHHRPLSDSAVFHRTDEQVQLFFQMGKHLQYPERYF